ncbi:TBC1 domain family member 13 [Spraguea lophii 42_110]|uniref:TBC1 domain family member 13 n=1 Tax=Spraguea lophii (strain 42_110) TaxID=1358809 RepID=S7W8M1_SPRLO|nr:TBC1 domain family member 13 [Spraguea lophii 42_110]
MSYFYIDEQTEFKLYKRIKEQLNWKNGISRNISELKNYCYYGYSNNELRPKYWKLFLNYLPDNKFRTEYFLKDRRKSYVYYTQRIKNGCNVVEDDMNRTILFTKDENIENEKKECSKNINSTSVSSDDMDYQDNISPNEDKLVDEPEYTDDNLPADNLPEPTQNIYHKKCKFLDSTVFDGSETHRDVIKRILLTYKSTNVTIGYVQGMNMLLIPIYYVFVNSSDIEDVKYAEADAFFCFLNLMCEIGDCFVPGLDFDQQLGIKRKLEAVIEILKEYDDELYNKLSDNNILELPFHLRWVTILLAHEFSIDETIILWDRLLADINRFEMVQYCCVGILVLYKNEIMKNTHDKIMEILQDINVDDVLKIFYIGDEIRRKIKSKTTK